MCPWYKQDSPAAPVAEGRATLSFQCKICPFPTGLAKSWLHHIVDAGTGWGHTLHLPILFKAAKNGSAQTRVPFSDLGSEVSPEDLYSPHTKALPQAAHVL